MSKLEAILTHLRDPKPDGKGGYMAFCPCHADGVKHGRRSLHVQEKNGKLLFYCFAGCRYEDIKHALGLDQREQEHGQEPEAVYDYRDENGKLLYQVLRFPGKRFRQRRPDGAGGWIWNLQGVKPVLYRLPELLQAVQRGGLIFVCEGEKDCNSLGKLGLVATTSPMGAGKWRDYYSDWLKGANVVILPDNDEPGREHAVQVANALKNRAKSVKVVELPGLAEKGDISDWLAAGGTKAALLEIVKQTPEYDKNRIAPIVTCLADVKPEEVSWLWEPYIPFGKLTILEGDPGIGKTWLAIQIAANVTTGNPFPDPVDGIPKEKREPANVIYMTAEDGLADTLRPRLDKAGADVSRVFALQGWSSTDPETGEKTQNGISLQHIPILKQALEQYKPALLVVDPLQAYLGAGVDMHRANEVRPVLLGLASLAEEYQVAVLLIRHLGKSQQDRAIYRGLGSIDFAAAARSILLVGQHPDDERRRVLAQSKSSLAAKGASIAFELREDGFYWCGVSDVTAEALLAPPKSEEEKSAVDEAADFLREVLADGPRPADEILKEARKTGIAEKTLYRAKTKLNVKTKRIGKQGKRGGGTWYWYLDCHEGSLNPESFINVHVDHLNQNRQTLAGQGIEATDLDGHMAILIDSPQTLGVQGFQGSNFDGQDELLEEDDQDDYHGNVKGGEVF